MNTYCSKVSIPIQPLINFDVYNPTRKRTLNQHYSNLEYVPLTYLNPELISFLSERNLQVSLIDIFYCNAGQSHPIHVDQPHVKHFTEGDYVRLNWIYGGSDSEMIWYETKNHVKKINRNLVAHMIYDEKDMNKIHSQNILGTQIVQVGVPHTVRAGTERRHAICCDISRKDYPSRVSMSEALEIFKDILV
jgi:hypothetical protein